MIFNKYIKTVSLESLRGLAKNSKNITISIRPILFTDVPAVYQVEDSSYDFPWSEKLIFDCIAVGYHGYLVEFDNQVIAYAIYRLAVGEAHLFNIAVLPEYQHKKVGNAFLKFLLDQMKIDGAKKVLLEVRVSNAAARNLYKKYGFKEQGIRKGYYPADNNTREDGINLVLMMEPK